MLGDRELLILQTIIDDFIKTAKPIGSRALSRKEDINLSSATIRNVMAHVEEMELLVIAPASSGRVPSQKGHRYYVDHVISPSLKEKDLHLLEDIIQGN